MQKKKKYTFKKKQRFQINFFLKKFNLKLKKKFIKFLIIFIQFIQQIRLIKNKIYINIKKFLLRLLNIFLK